MTSLLRILPCLLLLAAAPVWAEPARIPDSMKPWLEGLALLHSSRATDAIDWFGVRRQARPDDVCAYYFPALIYTNFNVEGLEDAEELDRGRGLIERGIELGEKQLDDAEVDPGTRYCVGALHGLRAEDRLKRSKYLRAAFDGKRARRIMLDLHEERPEFVDCRFWIGSYDYFADVLPGFIKFFRSLLFFPGGNKERGLSALAEVAARGTLDRYNALWMLYNLYGGFENEPKLARQVLEQLVAAYPDAIDAHLALAWDHARGSPPDRGRGIALHLIAFDRAQSFEARTRTRQVNRVQLSLARAYLDDLQPESAVELLQPMLSDPEVEPDRRAGVAMTLIQALNGAGRFPEIAGVLEAMRRRGASEETMKALETEAEGLDASSSRQLYAMLPARRMGREGRFAEAEAAFRSILAQTDHAALVHFVMADLYFEVERDESSRVHYRKVLEIGAARPGYLVPVSYLRLGHLEDIAGNRAEAKALYRMAAEAAGDDERIAGAAEYFLKRPYGR